MNVVVFRTVGQILPISLHELYVSLRLVLYVQRAVSTAGTELHFASELETIQEKNYKTND